MDFSFCGSSALFALCLGLQLRKRSNNKLKSWPNIRCRVGTEAWNDYEKNSETEGWREGSRIVCLNKHLKNRCDAGKVSSKLWDRAQTEHSWRDENLIFVQMTLKRSERSRRCRGGGGGWGDLSAVERGEVWRRSKRVPVIFSRRLKCLGMHIVLCVSACGFACVLANTSTILHSRHSCTGEKAKCLVNVVFWSYFKGTLWNTIVSCW